MSVDRWVGIRVDVDTHEGMRDGVPTLLDVFAAAGARSTFYLSMGPDRSGRAVLGMLRPGFLAKMRRNSAVRVYGLRTVLSGTLLPSRPIATAFPQIARSIAEAGHEVGVHAWDHRSWQDQLLRWPAAKVNDQLDRGRDAFRSIFDAEPRSFASPAWLSTKESLEHQESYGLDFGSDCRGREPFLPSWDGTSFETPQVPSTLPTLDELIGEPYGTARDYFAGMLDVLEQQAWPVLTVHAELEGGPYAADLRWFLEQGKARGHRHVALCDLLEHRLASAGPLPRCEMEHAPVLGRHGVLSTQGPYLQGPKPEAQNTQPARAEVSA